MILLQEYRVKWILWSFEEFDSTLVHIVDAHLGFVIDLVVLRDTEDSLVDHGLHLHLLGTFVLGYYTHCLADFLFSHIKFQAPALLVDLIQVFLQD